MIKWLLHILDNIVATGLVFFVLVYLSFYFSIDFMDPIQNVIQEFYLSDFVFSKMRDYDKVAKDTNIVLVNVGDIPRVKIAEQIEIINSYQPKAIGIDLFFHKELGEEKDSIFEAAISKVNNLFLVSKLIYNDSLDDFDDSIVVSNHRFNRYAKNGFANIITTVSESEEYFRTVRNFFPKAHIAGEDQYAFSVMLANTIDSNATKRFLERGNEEEIINYKRNYDKYITLDVDDVFLKRDSLGFIKDKLVLFGIMGPDLHTLVDEDVFFTPMNEQYIGKSLPDMYGVVIHANIISMICEQDFIYKVPDWASILIIVIIIILDMAIFVVMKEKIEKWYEPLSMAVVFFELFAIMIISLYIHYLFGVELKLQAVFFALIISTPIFELYHGSIKPLMAKIFKLFERAFKKTVEQTDGAEE
jgi:CHASE2 domain-containing sensor protein